VECGVCVCVANIYKGTASSTLNPLSFHTPANLRTPLPPKMAKKKGRRAVASADPTCDESLKESSTPCSEPPTERPEISLELLFS